MDDRKWIEGWIDAHASEFIDVSDEIWELSELAFHEYGSCRLLISRLRELGFEITEGIAGIPTAFSARASFGTGKPVLGILGEYDALSGLSQEASLPEKRSLGKNAGHGCGHCLLGAGSMAAAAAVAAYLKETGKNGTVIYFGCPAEEGAGSKQFMARAGAFDEVDFVYTWHPASINAVEAVHSNAIMGGNFTFRGLSSHAGATPYLGRSALDACELMSVGCNYLREHIIPEARISYAYIDSGGTAPNVVQDHAVVRYEVRAPYVAQVKDIFERVREVARGASIMTGTEYDCELAMAFTEYIPNNTLAKIMDECLSEIGAPDWDEADLNLAKSFEESYGEEVQAEIRRKMAELYGEERVAELWERPLDPEVHAFDPADIKLQAGSTDVGDVAAAVPTLNLNMACACIGNVAHTWQMTAQAASSIGHKGMINAAKVLALSSVRTMEKPDLITEARAELEKRNGGRYVCPLPDEVKPPLDTY